MTLASDFEEFVQLLNQHNIEYMIVGGYALAFHGNPRHTGDLDIWINISEDNAEKMIRVLVDYGLGSLGLKKADFLKPRYVTQIGYPPLRIDILNNIDGIEFRQALKSMQKIQVENNLTLNYIGLNDFIKNKQASGRAQDLADIKAIQKKKSPKKLPQKKKGKKL